MNTYHFSAVIEKDKDGYYAFCPELEGLLYTRRYLRRGPGEYY